MTKEILALIGCYVINLLGLRLTQYLMFGKFLFANKVDLLWCLLGTFIFGTLSYYLFVKLEQNKK